VGVVCGDGRAREVALAAAAAVGDLVVVEAAGQLRLVQMGGDVLVGHLLEASLKKVCFLV
jgi:hypothetical protein